MYLVIKPLFVAHTASSRGQRNNKSLAPSLPQLLIYKIQNS